MKRTYIPPWPTHAPNWPARRTPAAKLEADGELSAALSRLMVVVENYPDLKASENFKDLQTQLEGTENRITRARQEYNEAVKEYNAAIRRFPGSVVASLFGYDKKAYFQASEGSQSNPPGEFRLISLWGL